MKKVLTIISIVIVSLMVFFLSYNFTVVAEPNLYYQIYLDDQVLGRIESKEELEKYFVKKGEEVKSIVVDYQSKIELEEEKEEIYILYKQLKTKAALLEHIRNNVEVSREILNHINSLDEKNFDQGFKDYMMDEEEFNFIKSYVDANNIYLQTTKVSIPNGVEIKKVATYNEKINTVEEIYEKISQFKSATLEGYRITIKGDSKKEYVYVVNQDIFKEAVTKIMETFVGTDEYKLYINDEQVKIETTGLEIDRIYLNETVTVKKINMPLSERIYTNSTELSKYLLYGTTEKQKEYIVKLGDTLESVAFDNQLSLEDLLISNPQFTSKTSLLSEGRKISIGYLNPKISVIVEKTEVKDVVNKFINEEIKDPNLLIGDDHVIQKGVDGLDRVTYRIVEMNGQEQIVEITKKLELSPAVNQITKVGSKYQSSVGTLYNWRWPTVSGYYISQYYQYRYHPITKKYHFHNALDIAISHGTNIYAANNGVILEAGYNSSSGYYITINHNNGYYTRYAHMSKQYYTKPGQIVGKGTVIGLIGMTGSATGPHLHFEVWRGVPYGYGAYTVNPLSLY